MHRAGLLGFYTHFEVTEVFASLPDHAQPINIFTILVAEERLTDAQEQPRYLNPERIVLRSLKGWSFGIKRYLKPIAELVPSLDDLCSSGIWHASGHSLSVAKLVSIPAQFVPAENAGSVPINRVLKNNFWSGSHIFEWVDTTKTRLKALFDDPPALQELSEAVRKYVPIGLAGLSDRVGNILVQLPVTVLKSKFGEMRETGELTVDIAWHPKAPPRTLRVLCETEDDGAISGFNSRNLDQPQILLPMQDGEGLRRAVLWDEPNGLLLAASGEMSFIRSIELAMQIVGGEPRVFSVPNATGGFDNYRVGVSPRPVKNIVGDASSNPVREWRQSRIYREEASRLRQSRAFKQYLPQSGQQQALHEEAIEDVRFLIRQNGQDATWLWDPYLSADDIIKTLFHCPYADADLRALSDAQGFEAEQSSTSTSKTRFIEQQRAFFTGIKSNWSSLRLEFRARIGMAGWSFHDRFLLFPVTRTGAQVWSLGTSVNGLGKQHHILQRVEDGQLICDAFEDLWRQLDQPEHLVWKKP
ncbi:VPA1262 family N-terminal domain-containing protein [Bradyrhizobium sp. 26S5]|uniref:VPA1262 family N-terminal domain-containing protein n=1 Tax=Bradyrhizobium sp. 26S5 TaxID=3139729 RepID=UPI0030D3D1C4